MRKTTKPKPNFKNAFITIKRLLQYIGGVNKPALAVIMVCIFISSVISIIVTVFFRILIDTYIEPLAMSANPDLSGMKLAIIRLSLIYLISFIATFIYNRLIAVVAQNVLKKIRDDMFSHLQELPIKYFDTNKHGDIMSYFTNDTDTLRQLMTQSLPNIISSSLTIVFTAAAMLMTSLHLSLVVSFSIFIILITVKYISSKSAVHFIKMQQDIAVTNGYVEEMLSGQKVVKVFCHEGETIEEFDNLSQDLFQDAVKANTYANILMPTMMTLGTIQYILIAVIGGIMALNNIGSLTLGTIAAFMQLSRSFTMPLSQMSQQLNSVIMALAGAQRIFNLLDAEPDIDNGYVTLVNAKEVDGEIAETTQRTGLWAWKHPHRDGTLTYTKLTGDVRLHDVDFEYVAGKLVLKDISLFAKPGQKIALVGATGAGKTTITNLITRFYDIADGKIRYDGININKIKKPDLRHSIGIVLQDTALFTGTIMENIRYGRLDATDEEVYEASRLANADSFISMLPQGYDTYIEEGMSNLSQGQRQLISIARAAVADPPVMILDEATSSIDTRTESLVQKGMDKLMQNRTVFVIAHRLSTIRNSEAIMVMHNGEIIERGDHKDLINQKGRYYNLYTGAFELE